MEIPCPEFQARQDCTTFSQDERQEGTMHHISAKQFPRGNPPALGVPADRNVPLHLGLAAYGPALKSTGLSRRLDTPTGSVSLSAGLHQQAPLRRKMIQQEVQKPAFRKSSEAISEHIIG
jgi:hypothetical protein